jgi:diguanylate cyclase (GGDEF)-like protein/PAS domain S-box-containing protein
MGRFRSLQDPETLRQLVDRLGEGIYITNERGEILDANPACLEILGVSSLEELRRYRAEDLFADPASRGVEKDVLARDGVLREFEFQIRRPDGEERTVLDTSYTVRDPDTGEMLYHGILVDITSRKELERRLQEMSIRDPLTGCYNRRHLADLARRLNGTAEVWGAIVIDIDHFKAYNDERGHQAGDEVLVSLARFLLRNARGEDAVVRMGGDEFALLLVGLPDPDAAGVARRLKESAAGTDLPAFTLGWAVRREDECLEQTIHRADQGLLAARTRERRFKDRRRAQGR